MDLGPEYLDAELWNMEMDCFCPCPNLRSLCSANILTSGWRSCVMMQKTTFPLGSLDTGQKWKNKAGGEWLGREERGVVSRMNTVPVLHELAARM